MQVCRGEPSTVSTALHSPAGHFLTFASFWGVFWIDASSNESAKQSFCRIAEIGKVDRNERAAKAWLSQLELPWLLLIDSVDDPQITVENYIPGGKGGSIIITTRNHAHKVHGTVGSGFFHLERLDSDDANNLLLKAAQYEPRPWDSAVKQSAAIIAEALGYLPLALIHAGRAILNHLCSLGDYLDFYTENWKRIRHAWKVKGLRGEDEDSYMKVYSTYEILYHGLELGKSQASKDAIDLLKLFSFLHCENIRIDILIRAATNPGLELEHEKKDGHNAEHAKDGSNPEPLQQRLKNVWIGLLSMLLKDRSPPILPAVLHDVQASRSFDQLRLKLALKELDQTSLITYHDSNKSYSMHPLVHTWVRERPEMSTAEQAVWSQVAATTLSQCILLPPLGTTEYDEDLRRNLLPHVDFVRKCQKGVEARIHENRKSRKKPWPAISSKFGQKQAIEAAKFSMVYSQCGIWDETERLQLPVKKFACDMLGMAHPRATLIVLALSGTYFHQGRVNDAAELQRQLLKACVSALGTDHPRALKVRDELGKTLCYQSRFREALGLHKEAVEGMSKVLGEDHKDTLLAIDNLGVVYSRYLDFEKARELHAKAVARMGRVFGPLHLDTLISKERLAMTCLDITGEPTSTIGDLRSAHATMDQVLEERKAKLGKEHPYTLLAFCNLARIKNALGNSDEAEKIIHDKLPIAERNLGDKHLGVVAAKVHLGQVLVRQKRYVEAETMFHDLMQLEKYQIVAREEGEHVDRIVAMVSLLRCYEIQGKVEDALQMCEKISRRIMVIDGLAHPLAQVIEDKRRELEAMRP